MSNCYTVKPKSSLTSEPCPCCGDITVTMNGFVDCHDVTIAAYLVSWIKDRVPDHGARWELIIGAWGDGTSADDRQVVRVDFRSDGCGDQAIMVVDATNARTYPRLASHRMNRADVIGTPFAAEVFRIYDAIALGDDRLEELHGISGLH